MKRRVLPQAAALLLFVGATASLRAQAASPAAVLYACYIPQSGVMYRVGAADLRAQTPTCVSQNHVLFSWNDGLGRRCPIGQFLLGFDAAGELICVGPPASAEV